MLPALPGLLPPQPTNNGGFAEDQAAQAYDARKASLMASLMLQQQPQQDGVTASYRRNLGTRNSARPSPQGQGTPLANSVTGAKGGGSPAPTNSPFVVQGNNPFVTPGQLPQQTQAPQPGVGGVTLGNQADGGRNVQLIRGGQSSIQHFDAAGNPVASNPKVSALQSLGWDEHQMQAGQHLLQAGLPLDKVINLIHKQGTEAGTGKEPDWNKATEQARFQHTDLERQANHLDSMIGKEMDPAKQAALTVQRDALHNQMNEVGRKISSPHAVEEYELGLKNAAIDRESDSAVAMARAKMGEGKASTPYTMANYLADKEAKPMKMRGVLDAVSSAPGTTLANIETLEKNNDLIQSLPMALKDESLTPNHPVFHKILEAAGNDPVLAHKLATQLGYK